MAAIGVDHVQFSVPDLETSTSFLQALGWRLEFTEPGFAPTARPYFRGVGKSMAYLKRGRAAIELIDGSGVEGPEAWRPIFDVPLPGERLSEVPLGIASGGTRVAELGCACLHAAESGSTDGGEVPAAPAEVELQGVLLSSPQPAASAAFLERFGFRPPATRDARGHGGALHLSFPQSIIGMGLELSIIEGPEASGEHFVDDLGLCLIALLAKDLEEDRRELASAGFRTTEIFDYSINGRSISNVVVTGPAGELVELIQIGRA